MNLLRRLSAVLSAAALSAALAGCVSKAEFDTCVRRNQIQEERIKTLEAARDDERLRADKLKQQLDGLLGAGSLCQQQLDALNAQLAAKNALLDRLASQMTQTPLPAELSSALADWAAQVGPDLVEYDEKTGIVRFKSDLLFAKGEDTVSPDAVPKLEGLARILASPAAQGFDGLIVGHTDDIPILKPDTLAKHPTNWYLSAHRAIAVERILGGAMPETRLAVMGLGEFRPIAPNESGRRGNPKNRRVEIYIVPSGSLRIGVQAGPAAASASAAPTAAPAPAPRPAAPRPPAPSAVIPPAAPRPSVPAPAFPGSGL